MEEIERIIRAAYDLGALSASAGAARFYQARGWVAWRGPTGVVTPAGLTRTPDEDDSTFVLPVPSGRLVDVTGMLACDWREGDVW
jgi:aminoglycoside 2'-N-acetyltransferase I